MSESKRLLQANALQMMVALLFSIYIIIAYMSALWSQNYLERVEKDWEANPIIDIQLIKQTQYLVTPACPAGYDYGA